MARKVDIGRISHIWNIMSTQRKFSMMQVYEVLIEDRNRVDWYHMMTHNFARPRAKVIMWLVCQDRLPTKTSLKHFGLLQHTNCEFCNEEEEDLEHLMFNCKETTSIWQMILSWPEIKENRKIDLNWIKRKTKGKGWKMGPLKATIAEVFYGI
ncbi:uncharacterized protein LOC131597889 [Vicia villosa]|uniref:uncharacterized protein LOC131597889 n=1 Tax=Vicia villosa TaxID=3911 RepID=UPI00273CF396|nr:uncharacterized protein LOC131597889 [Vicia villosa]